MSSTSTDPRSARPFLRWAVFVLLGILALELYTEVRMLAIPVTHRHFPQDYITKGFWTPWALIRPPHSQGSDFIDPLRAARQVIHRDPDLYAGFDGRGCNYVYPPTAATVLQPFGLIAERWGDARATHCFDIGSRLVALCVLSLILWKACRKVSVSP